MQEYVVVIKDTSSDLLYLIVTDTFFNETVFV